MMQPEHGTVVDIAGLGVFLRGRSGSGKSDMALRLIDRGASLVADDQVILEGRQSGLRASAPEALYGFLEVRGLGVLSLPAIRQTRLKLIVDLVPSEAVERLPKRNADTLVGIELPVLALNAFEHSAVLKIELAVRNLDRIGAVGERSPIRSR